MPPKSLKEVKTVEEKYKKYELLEHILALPDTYIGSIESQKINSIKNMNCSNIFLLYQIHILVQ